MAGFTMVRFSITIVSRAKSSITKTFTEVCTQRRHGPCLPRGVTSFFLKRTKKESSARWKSLLPTRETMAWSFLSRWARWTLWRKMTRLSHSIICFVVISFTEKLLYIVCVTFTLRFFVQLNAINSSPFKQKLLFCHALVRVTTAE